MDEHSEDDDFSDLYADVELQASSAICAMHGKTEVAAEKNAVSVDAFDFRPPLSRGDGVDDLKPRPSYFPFSNNLKVCDRASAGSDLEGNERGQLIDETPVTNQSRGDFSHPRYGCYRDFRHTRESEPESLKPALVYADSDEDEQHQVIEPDSDESEGVIEASNGMIEKNETSNSEQETSIWESESDSDESSVPKQEPSKGEPESSKSGQDQCYRGHFCSLSPDDRRRHMHSKLTSLSSDLEPQEMVNNGYRYSHRSDKHITIANTRGIQHDNSDKGYTQRRHERSRKSPRVLDREFGESPFGRKLSKYSDSYGSSRKEVKMRRTSDRASDVRAHRRDSGAYDTTISRNIRHFRGSENSSHDYYGFVSVDDRRPIYRKEDAYPNVQHRGHSFDDDYHLDGEQKFVNGKISTVDYGYYKDDWCDNRRHSHKEMDTLDIGARRLTSYFSHDLNGRSSSGSKKEDGMRFRRRREGDDLSPCTRYGTEFSEGRRSRFALHGGREEIDCFNLVDDHDTLRDRRELESPKRVKRRKYTSHFNGFDGAFRIKNEQNNSGPFQRATEKNFSVSEGPAFNDKFSWKDRLGGPSQRGFNDAYFDEKQCLMHHSSKDLAALRSCNHQYSSLFNSDERITNHSYQDHFDEKSYLVHQVHNHNVNEACYKHASTGYEFGRIRDSICPENCTELYPRYRVSSYPHLAIKDQESSRRTSEARDAMNSDRNNYTGKDINQKPKRLKESKDRSSGKSIFAERRDKYVRDYDIEEGQIVSEETSGKRLESVIVSENVAQNDDVEGLDDKKIQEIMKKMEQRRERFKEPIIITSNEDSEKTCKALHVVDSKPSRPPPKRRWI